MEHTMLGPPYMSDDSLNNDCTYHEVETVIKNEKQLFAQYQNKKKKKKKNKKTPKK